VIETRLQGSRSRTLTPTWPRTFRFYEDFSTYALRQLLVFGSKDTARWLHHPGRRQGIVVSIVETLIEERSVFSRTWPRPIFEIIEFRSQHNDAERSFQKRNRQREALELAEVAYVHHCGGTRSEARATSCRLRWHGAAMTVRGKCSYGPSQCVGRGLTSSARPRQSGHSVRKHPVRSGAGSTTSSGRFQRIAALGMQGMSLYANPD